MSGWRNFKLLQYGAQTLAKMSAIVREELAMTPAKRKAKEAARVAEEAARWRQASQAGAAGGGGGDPKQNAIVTAQHKLPWWQQQWESVKAKVMNTWVFRRLRKAQEHPVVMKGQEIAEDLRERWETSDSPFVHRIQDLNDSLFGETATAMAYKEIRLRDPGFLLTEFVSEVQEDVRPMVEAYMKGDLEALKVKCSREIVERCGAEKRILEAQGLKSEDRLLHISDVELREAKLVGNNPVIILSFRTQQVHCITDRYGVVTEGGRQGSQEEVAEANAAIAMGNAAPPKWRLREMQQLGLQALI